MAARDGQGTGFCAAWLAVWVLLAAVSFPFAEPEFRLWERLYEPDARRFARDRSETMREIGDLGYKSWVRALQAPRTAVFSTDRFGFRNPELAVPPRIVVIGDSYVAGASLSDRDTLTAQLSRALDEPVYNFATQYLNGPAMFLREPRFAETRPEIVVWAPVARAIRPRPLFIQNWNPPKPPPSLGERVAQRFERINRDNQLVRRMRFLVQGALFRLRGYPGAVELPGGESALVLSLAEQGLLVPAVQRGVGPSAAMLRALDEVFAKAGIRFVFAPIPESGTIYPELFPEAERAQIATPSFLEVLVARARTDGIEVVDFRPTFRAHRWPYLFQRDDTHWNPRAVMLAAGALEEHLHTATPRAPTAVATER